MPPRALSSLAALAARGDPLADDAVAALVARGARPRAGESALALVEELARETGDRALVRFLDEARPLPAWARVDEHRAGRRAMTRQAPVAFLVLLAGSLVESFALKDGAAVLASTGRLLRDPVNRIYETAALVHAVLAHDLAPGSRAHEALLRVRLLHAFVRRFAHARRTPSYCPVNQAEMLHTLIVFSRVVADGVVALGGSVDDEERASWCALWRTAGALLGVDDDVLYAGVAEEAAAHDALRALYDVGDDARALAFAVLGALSGEPPFFLPLAALQSIARRLIGDGLADAFAFPRDARWARLVAGAAGLWRGVDRVERRAPFDAGVRAGAWFIEKNRARILRTRPAADFAFRTAPARAV